MKLCSTEKVLEQHAAADRPTLVIRHRHLIKVIRIWNQRAAIYCEHGENAKAIRAIETAADAVNLLERLYL